MATNKLDYNSPLLRKRWVKDRLLQDAHKSFWRRFTGTTSDSVVYQERNTNASTGHTVVFDYSGKLTGKAYRGDDYTYGRGETKRRFSNQITVEEFSLYVDNGSKFDAVAFGDLNSAQHQDSIRKLSDLFQRHKDQALFDVAQGAVGTPPTHILNLGNTFTYNDLLRIESAAKKGEDLVVPDAQGVVSNQGAVKRAPLEGWSTQDGEPIYIAIIDEYMATALKRDPNYQTIVVGADVRGQRNRALDMAIGRLGNVVYIEAPVFFGYTEGAGTFTLFDTEPQFSGLRRYARDDDGRLYWEGQTGYDLVVAKLKQDLATGTTTNYDNGCRIYSRGLLLGAGALQSAWGKDPDYVLEWGAFKKTSQSMLDYWANFQKTILTVENGTDYAGKVANIDYGVIALDLEHTYL